jgi:hypothetical protein
MAQAAYVHSAIRALPPVASACFPTRLICAAYGDLIAALMQYRPRSIPIDTEPADVEDRADHLNKVLIAMSLYVTAFLDDIGQNVPGGLELRQTSALLSDLESEVNGTLQHAVDCLAGSIA